MLSHWIFRGFISSNEGNRILYIEQTVKTFSPFVNLRDFKEKLLKFVKFLILMVSTIAIKLRKGTRFRYHIRSCAFHICSVRSGTPKPVSKESGKRKMMVRGLELNRNIICHITLSIYCYLTHWLQQEAFCYLSCGSQFKGPSPWWGRHGSRSTKCLTLHL